ncbi:carbon-nitrogen hydrolase family protein [Sulfuriflexus sp.]|uniref:carbon-nitrogen hydrolase family protein n=1 Tax=Sulfuriflexus sp. TaxID=2015443 RepID=UPI0028CBC86E|nr:carbon-nitrogen hydrolase family protein [Sulfuriflexus sp.]MDT8404461.1 carbon-nitrogen hydrolase family protein [Sulfuriflexus sp.]
MSQIAAIQMASGPNVNSNLIEAARLIDDAAKAGAQMIVLPENFAFLGQSEADKFAHVEEDGHGVMQDFLAEEARKHGVWLVGGTVPMQGHDKKRVRQVCLLLNDKGERVARYDKIHLFDVHIAATAENYNESETIEPGNEVVVVHTPFGKMGIAICYDLRFPELFRRMLDEGVEIIALPSAFTAITGKAHWESLVRARAIENLVYFIAADQGGYHINGRETHGDSMIVDPWGQILDRLPSGSGFIMADIDHKHVSKVRSNFPATNHRRISCNLSDSEL